MVERKKYCVNGQWKESKTKKWMDVSDSSTGEVIAQVPCCTADEVEEAIAAADADRFLAALAGRNVDDVLQQVSAGMPMALELRREQAAPSLSGLLPWPVVAGCCALALFLAGLRAFSFAPLGFLALGVLPGVALYAGLTLIFGSEEARLCLRLLRKE